MSKGAATGKRNKSSVLAGLLSFFAPGLGHWYAGYGKRGLAWFGLFVVYTALVVAAAVSFDITDGIRLALLVPWWAAYDAIVTADGRNHSAVKRGWFLTLVLVAVSLSALLDMATIFTGGILPTGMYVPDSPRMSYGIYSIIIDTVSLFGVYLAWNLHRAGLYLLTLAYAFSLPIELYFEQYAEPEWAFDAFVANSYVFIGLLLFIALRKRIPPVSDTAVR